MKGFITKPMIAAGVSFILFSAVFIVISIFRVGTAPVLRDIGTIAAFCSWALAAASIIVMIVLVVKRIEKRRVERVKMLMERYK